ncbi:hypothetical protein EV122DRAFT_183154, partial [Schizophyllum commune]
PDISPIENLWDYLDRKTRQNLPPNHTLEQWWAALQHEWRNIPHEYISHLYDSMPRRLEALRRNHGLWTKY